MTKNYILKTLNSELVRRYIITNSFDGVLATLGIVFAVMVSDIHEPKYIILPGIGAAIAIFISGIWGVFSAERAEIKQRIATVSHHLLRDLSETQFAKSKEKMSYVIAVVGGLSSFINGLIILSPFFLAEIDIINMKIAYVISLTLAGIILFLVGIMTGKTAKENVFKHGFIMLFAGLVIAIIFLILAKIGIL